MWFIYALCWSHSQVRCAAVFALGTFVGNSAERTDHSTTIDHNVAMMLAQLINDGSPIVRKASLLEFYQHHYHSLKSVLMVRTVPLGTIIIINNYNKKNSLHLWALKALYVEGDI